MFEVNIDASDYSHLTTQEMISDEIWINVGAGKPDKLSFQYMGEEFKIGLLRFFGGAIKFQQRIGSEWTDVPNSTVTPVKNEWNTKSDLQLDENAVALRIVRETGATGHHKIQDIQITRKQYLRASETEINLGEVKSGDEKIVNIGFDYSDIKGDLTAHTINNTTDLTIADNGAIDLPCGSFGQYDLPVTFEPNKKDTTEWQGTVEVYDPITHLSITVVLTATVIPNEEFVFEKEGLWNDSLKWSNKVVPDSTIPVTVRENVTINISVGVKSLTIEENATVTVPSGVTVVIGNGTPKSRETYGNLYVEDGGQVILSEDATLNVNNFFLEASLGTKSQNGEDSIPSSSGIVTNDHDQLHVAGDAYFKMAFDPSGQVSYGFYDFTVPFEVAINSGIFKEGDLVNPVRSNVDFQIGEFDEARYANGQRPWVQISNTLKPGKLYTITFDTTRVTNTIVFKKKAGAQGIGSSSYEAVCSGETSVCGWNGIGNGMLYHGYPNNESHLQTYDHATNTYGPVVGKKTFAVGSAMFVQTTAGTIDWTAANASEERPLYAPRRQAREVEEFLLSLAVEGSTKTIDHLWVSASEDAYADYTIGRDLLKMGEPSEAKAARMWAVRGDMRLCDIEMLMRNYSAICALDFQTPNAGTYVVAVEEAPAGATLYLTKNDHVIWNLSMSPYELELEQGKTEGYGLRIIADRQTPTDLENDASLNNESGVRKVLIDDKIYVITPEGAMYDALGKGVKF